MTLSDEYLTTELSHTHMHNNDMCAVNPTPPDENLWQTDSENGSSSCLLWGFWYLTTSPVSDSSAGTHSHLCHQISSDYEPVPFKKVTNLGGIL